MPRGVKLSSENDNTQPPKDDSEADVAASSEGNASSELEDMKKKFLYLRADFENYKKQAFKERSDLVKYGAEPILREFLGILDNLERAAEVELSDTSIEKYKSGVDLIVGQFRKSLERFGVEEVKSEGQEFDPAIHEAIGADANPNEKANVITQVLKKAYKLHGKLIRPAQVLVNDPPKKEK